MLSKLIMKLMMLSKLIMKLMMFLIAGMVVFVSIGCDNDTITIEITHENGYFYDIDVSGSSIDDFSYKSTATFDIIPGETVSMRGRIKSPSTQYSISFTPTSEGSFMIGNNKQIYRTD